MPTRYLYTALVAALFASACSLTDTSAPARNIRPTLQGGQIIRATEQPTRTPIGDTFEVPTIQLTSLPQNGTNNTSQMTEDRIRENLADPNCPVPDGWTRYTVQAGDSLFQIALDNDLSTAELAEANCLIDPSRIEVGQVLAVP